MKIKLIAGTLGLVSMLIVSLANAATVNLTPSSSVINDGEQFNVLVHGEGFTDGLFAGNLSLTWDDTILRLDQSTIDITISALLKGFDIPFGAITLASNSLDIVFSATQTFDPGIEYIAGPNLDFFSLVFTMIAPSTSDVTVDLGPSNFGVFQDGNGGDINGITFNNATIAVSAVPIPAAVWLLASGLLGLIGVARRRSSTATTRIATASPALA